MKIFREMMWGQYPQLAIHRNHLAGGD